MPVALSRLKKTALKSERLFKHATLIIKGGRILTCQFNNWYEHSEIRAIKSITLPRGSTFVNIRIKKNDKIGSSFPCLHCLAKMREMKVRKVIYSDHFGKFKEFFL